MNLTEACRIENLLNAHDDRLSALESKIALLKIEAERKNIKPTKLYVGEFYKSQLSEIKKQFALKYVTPSHIETYFMGLVVYFVSNDKYHLEVS